MKESEEKKSELGHGCCHGFNDFKESVDSQDPADSTSRATSYVAGIVGGIAACLCCCLPVILVAVGVAGVSNLSWLSEYHLLLEILGWIVMTFAVLFLWWQNKRVDVPLWKDKHFWVPLICMIVVYTSMNYVIKTVVAPKSHNGSGHVH